MNPLQPQQQTVFEQGPQSSVGMGPTPIVDYREEITQLSGPINPSAAIDMGINWQGLGQQAFDVAGKLYEQTLDNVIEGKDASIQAIGYDLQNDTDDLYQGFQIRLKKAEIAGESLTQEDILALNLQYEKLKGSYNEKAIKVLGASDFARFTEGNPDLSDVGSKYRRLALQTRKSYFDIENNITKVMYDMESQQHQLTVQNENKSRMASGNGPTGSRQPSMTRGEMANIPFNPMINGMNPITTKGKAMLPVSKDGTEFGRDSAGQILVDEFGKPVLVEGGDKEFYINPEADLSVLGEDHLNTIAKAEAEGGYQTSATGRIIHPAAQKQFKDLVTGRLSDSAALIAMKQLRYVDVRTINNLTNDDGGSAFSAKDVMRLSVMHSMSRNSATAAQLKQFQDNDANNPEALEIAHKYVNSLKRGSKTMAMEGRIDRAGTEETIYGTGVDQTALATISNAVVRAAASAAGVSFETYIMDEDSLDVLVDGEEGNESIVDFLDRNPQMKIMIERAYLAVVSNPTITRGGTEDTDKKRSEEINEFMKNSFVPAEFDAADLTVIGGVVISSKSVKSVDRAAGQLDSIINSANITQDQKDAYTALNKDEKRKVVAQAELRNTNGSGTLDTDTKEVATSKQLVYIGKWNPSADKQVVGAMVAMIGQTQVNRRGTTTAKNGLSDGELARIAMAANPEVYAAMGLVPNTPDAAAKVRAMSIEEKIQLAGEAWQMIPSAENWEMNLDLGNLDQLEGDNSGIPIAFSAISAQTVDGTNVNLIDSLTSRDNLDGNGAYMFRQRDNNNTPIVRIGQRILNENNQLVANSERDMGLAMRDLIEARADGSMDNRETTLRGAGFPSRTDTGATDDVRAIDAIPAGAISKNKKNFAQYYASRGLTNAKVRSAVDLMNQLDLPENKAARVFFQKLDPDFKGDAAGSSLLDTITRDFRAETQANTGELRTGSGEGKFDDALFTPAMMEVVMAKAKGLGLETVSDHLALLFEVAHSYRSNSEFDLGYNMKEYRASTASMFNGYKPNVTGDQLEEMYPDTIPMGPKFGMILYNENSSEFLPKMEGLIEAGNSIYTKTGTKEYYAFATPPSSPDFVLYHSAANQITPAVEGTPDTMVTTTERTLAPAPQGGWNGWGPRYENVTKTTGTKGTPAQAATGKTTDLTKAFEANRLNRLFLSAAQSNRIAPSVSEQAYVAEKQMVAIQSDVSRILAADWKTIKETPAALAKGVVELENFGRGTPVQEMRLEQRKSANDFGLWARTKMMEPAMAAMLASYKEEGAVNFMKTPASAGLALRAAFYSFFGMDEDVVNNLSHEQTVELQKTIEAAPEGKVKNITLTAVDMLHKEHMAMDGDAHDTTKNQRYITAPEKDYVTEANYNFTAPQPSANDAVKEADYGTVIPMLGQSIPNWSKMSQSQQGALISFAISMGPDFYGAPNRETLTAALKSPLTWYKVPAALKLYTKTTSKTSGKLVLVQDLIKRRITEANLWKETK